MTYENRIWQWAAGFYIAANDGLFDKYFEWDNEQQEEFLQNNAWEPFQYWEGHQIAEEIDKLASSTRSFFGTLITEKIEKQQGLYRQQTVGVLEELLDELK